MYIELKAKAIKQRPGEEQQQKCLEQLCDRSRRTPHKNYSKGNSICKYVRRREDLGNIWNEEKQVKIMQLS